VQAGFLLLRVVTGERVCKTKNFNSLKFLVFLSEMDPQGSALPHWEQAFTQEGMRRWEADISAYFF
jgi:hypothetical protein